MPFGFFQVGVEDHGDVANEHTSERQDAQVGAIALDGFFGQSGVQLDVLYHIQGQRSRFTAGFSGSISDLAVNLVTAVTDAIF